MIAGSDVGVEAVHRLPGALSANIDMVRKPILSDRTRRGRPSAGCRAR